MKIQIFLLGTVLLPSFVLLQATKNIDNGTVGWLKEILSLNDMKISTENSPEKTSVSVTSTTDISTGNLVSKSNPLDDPNLEQDFEDSANCVTDDGSDGLCVLYHQCDDKGLIDNTTLIDLRASNCPHYLMKCCLPSEAYKRPKKVETLTPRSECGWSNPDASILRFKDPAQASQNNINKQTYADYGEFPWMVALIKKHGSGEWSQKNFLGGGTIIHPSVVVTAAHKIDKYLAEEIKCRAGEWDTQTDLEFYPYQERDVRKVITHEEYYRTPVYNDISLLILEKPYDLTDAPHIGVACLSPDLPTPGKQCFSMGWGKEFQKKDKYAVILKKVQLSYVGFEECQASLRKTNLTDQYSLHLSHMCAGGEQGVDTCKGDGGSSLVCPIMENDESTRFAVYGMVAFGVGCGDAIPGVYVNIPHLYRWIGEKMENEDLDRSSYRY